MKYAKPEMNVIYVEVEDIVTGSLGMGESTDGNENITDLGRDW